MATITINPAKPHEAILAANEAKGLSENDRQRIIASAERQVAEHRARVLDRVERDTAQWTAEADAAHDDLAAAEVAYDEAVKAAKDGGLSSAELSTRLEEIQREQDKALARLDKAEVALARISEDEADPYAAHLRMVRRFPTLAKVGTVRGERTA